MTSFNRSRSVALYAPLGTYSPDQGPAAYAVSLSRGIGASLTGILPNIEANLPRAAKARTLAEAEQESRDRDAANSADAAMLEQKCAGLGVPVQTITVIDHSRGMLSFIADHARLHDVLVAGSARNGLLGDRIMAEGLLFETGRPIIVVPTEHSGEFSGKRIVAAWDNSRNAARALGDALALLPELEEVALVTIGDDKTIHSSLDDATLLASLTGRGVAARIENRTLAGRKIGDALQDTALELGADLLVMGGCGHSRLRDFLLGGATVSVLDHPRLPILLAH